MENHRSGAIHVAHRDDESVAIAELNAAVENSASPAVEPPATPEPAPAAAPEPVPAAAEPAASEIPLPGPELRSPRPPS